MTNGQPPSRLLARASEGLPDAQIKLLHQTYGEKSPAAKISPNLPLQALKARHDLKHWLSQNADVPFTVLPPTPDLDRVPLPLYEAARLNGHEEERAFEQWLLSDLDLCKDIAEFSAFAHAMRAGVLNVKPAARVESISRQPDQTTTTPAQPSSRPIPNPPSQPTTGGAGRFVVIALIGAAIVAAIFLAKMFLG